MRENWNKINEQIKALWEKTTKLQKTLFISISALLIILIIVITVVTSTAKYVPLYSNLSLNESSQIKEALEARNVPYEITDGGKTVKVPEEQAERLLVELAGEKIPKSGNIDYSFFSENSSWGITDNEFNIMKLDAIQTELAKLLKSIDGIEDAEVRIVLPEQSVFVTDSVGESSAAIVIHTGYGHEFKGNQIESLYHLVSKAVPNLPLENIQIRNQFLEYYDLATTDSQDDFSQQQSIKRDVEKDIQTRLQQMLGAMVGLDSVLVSVTADIDYTQENRFEELVEPVDVDNMEGIPISIENIQETYEGTQGAGGIAGTGEEDIPNYPASLQGEDGNYDLVKETVNYELNRINREIAEAPFKIRDLGIQVIVDNVKSINNDEIELLTQGEQQVVEEGIASILNSMVTTSIDKEYGEVDLEERVSIVFQQFNSKQQDALMSSQMIGKQTPIWMYILGGVLILVIILLVVMLMRRRKAEETIEEPQVYTEPVVTEKIEVSDITNQPKTEADIQLEQLEKMAQDKPEDFAKLLRSWISED